MQLSKVIKHMNVRNPARGAGSFLDKQGKTFNNKTEKTKKCSKIFPLFIWKKRIKYIQIIGK